MTGLLKCSRFSSARDPWPRGWEGSWVDLQTLLDRDAVPARGTAGADAKRSLPAISGTIFRRGSRRSRASALSIGVLLGDFDNAEEVPTGDYHLDASGHPTDRPRLEKRCSESPVDPGAVLEALQSRGIAGYLYTTWSHEEAWPRFRMVVPLARPVPVGLWRESTDWGLCAMGLQSFREGLDLPVLRDVARIHFLPAAPAGRTVQRWVTSGKPLEIPSDRLRIASSLPRSPNLAMWQRRILARRALEGRWDRSVRLDLSALDLADLLRRHGIQVGEPGPYQGGLRWRTHCPWAGEHSHGLDDDSGVVIHFPGRWPIWKCAHSHHAHLGLRDVLDYCGELG